MKLRVLVREDRPDEYTGKKGLVKQQVLSLIDWPANGEPAMTTALEYTLSPAEKEQYAGKLQSKVLMLSCREIMVFGGRLRIRGQIDSIEKA